MALRKQKLESLKKTSFSMNKITREDLIKLIQKQLDIYPEPELYSFLIVDLREPLDKLCSNLQINKEPTYGKHISDHMNLLN